MAEPEIERGPGYLVKRVQQGLRRRCDAALKPTGLSMAQYALLRALHDHPDASGGGRDGTDPSLRRVAGFDGTPLTTDVWP